MSNDFVARYYRFHQLYKEPVKTVDEAIYFLAAGIDQGQCVPEDVTRRDGTVVLDNAETLRRVHVTLDDWDRDGATTKEEGTRPDEETTT